MSTFASPDDASLPPAIDRHMFNLALGLSSPTKREQADIAHDLMLYARVEEAFVDMGRREGIGNRLASICWFVQRRLERTGQRALDHAGGPIPPLPGPVCCGRLMRVRRLGPARLDRAPAYGECADGMVGGSLADDALSSLELLDVAYHGSIHASALYVARDVAGRFVSIDDPGAHGGIFSWPRLGPVLGRSARG